MAAELSLERRSNFSAPTNPRNRSPTAPNLMDQKPNRNPLIIRIPIRPKNPTPPAAAQNNEEATIQKLSDRLFGKLAAASVPLSPALKSQINHRLRELVPSFHTPDHPPYSLMISKAIEELDEELGSNESVISDFILREYKNLSLAHNFMLSHYLGKLCEVGEVLCTDGERYLLPGNEKKKRKGWKRKRSRWGGSTSGGDEGMCQGQALLVKQLCGGGGIWQQIEQNGGAEKKSELVTGKGKRRNGKMRIWTRNERVEERQAMEVAEQSQAVVLYGGSNRGNELSVEVGEDGSEEQRQEVKGRSESQQLQDDLMDLLDWNPVALTMLQLENSQLVRQAWAQGPWAQRTWCQETSCASDLEKLKQEVAERLRGCRGQCYCPSFVVEVKQLKEEVAKIKLDMQEFAAANHKVHLDVELLMLKKTYAKLLEKTSKVLEWLMGIPHSRAEVEEPSHSHGDSNSWTEIAKSLPVTTETSEVLEETAITSLDAPLYLGYTVHDQQPGLSTLEASLDLPLVEAGSTSPGVSTDSAFEPTTMEQPSQEEQQPKHCFAFEVEEEEQPKFPNTQKPVELELRTLEQSSRTEQLQQGISPSKTGLIKFASIVESKQDLPNYERPHKAISRITEEQANSRDQKKHSISHTTTLCIGLAAPSHYHKSKKQVVVRSSEKSPTFNQATDKRLYLTQEQHSQGKQISRMGHEPSKTVQDTTNVNKVTESTSLSPHQKEQGRLLNHGKGEVDLSTYPRITMALNTRGELQLPKPGNRTIVVCLPHSNQHPRQKGRG